jgi:hypothetical protein
LTEGFYIVDEDSNGSLAKQRARTLKELSTWFILNHKCEPVIWIEGGSELGWYFACVECGANDRTKLPVVKKFQRPEAPPKYSEQNAAT